MTETDTVEMAAAEERAVQCPRCGYDQRGVIESWTEACPLAGLCSECGLAFEWRELLGAEFQPPRWCVEHMDRWSAVPGGIVRTLAMAIRPWRFWSDLRMTHPMRPRRLIAYLAVLWIALYLVFAASMGLAATRCWPFNTGGAYISTKPAGEVAVYTAAFPLSRRMQGMAMPSAALAATGAPPLGCLSPFDVFSSAFLHSDHVAFSLLAICGVFLICPLGFLALPQSRKEAKVRWGHIARIFVYSAGPWVVLTALALWSGPESLNGQRGGTPWLADRIVLGTMVAAPAFCLAWWSFAAGRYLKMRHAWAVGGSVTIMAGLGAAVLIFLPLLV